MSNKNVTRNFEIRAADGEEFCLVGRAIAYGEISSSELMQGYRERIMAGAFRASLASGRDVKALFNHDQGVLPLGRLANGTLVLTDSDEGLDMRVQLDRGNRQHRDVYASVKRRDVSEMSFGFIAEDDDLSEDSYQGVRCKVRNVRKAQLLDVSIVCTPFYGQGATAVSARAANEGLDIDAANRAQLDTYHRTRAAELGKLVAADKERAI